MGQDYRSLNYSKGSIFNPAFLHEKAGLLLNNARISLVPCLLIAHAHHDTNDRNDTIFYNFLAYIHTYTYAEKFKIYLYFLSFPSLNASMITVKSGVVVG